MSKLPYIAIISFFLLGCSSPDSANPSSEATSTTPSFQTSVTSESIKNNTLSSTKKAFIQGCLKGGGSDKGCNCQFKVLNASLSKSIGKDWYKQSIRAEDEQKYVAASEKIIKQCKQYDASNAPAQSSNDNALEYEAHYNGKFYSMQECLSSARSEANKNGMSLDITRDKPDVVSGSFNGNAEWFFYCKIQETGTEGTYYEGAVPKFK
jgi:hypothetical protein